MATTTARPRKRAAASKAAPAKPAEETPAAEAEEAAAPGRITFSFEIGEETKQYQKISPPADSGCVGTLYVPKGVKRAKILLEG